ncbi:MAG: ABC transporter permease, partial [Myxococcales bacterium]|nr:ABC transporter permease [Myxococcales bacterium]
MWARIWAIALNTFREAVRNKVLAILVLFAVALMAFSLVLGQLSLHEEVRIIKDLGLAGISLFGVVIALFLGVNLLSKELDRKTVYAIIPKPLHRWEFLLGKYLGLVVTMTALVVLMSLVLAAFLAVQGGGHGVTMVRAEVLIWLELLLLMAVAMLFSSFSSPWLS